MSQYLAQGKYDDDFREWMEEAHYQRLIELELLLAELNDDTTEEQGYIEPSSRAIEAERRRRADKKWQWDIQRRMRELIRWEREDLEWKWKLERRERYTKSRLLGTDQEDQDTRQNGYRRLTGPQPGKKKNRQHKKRSHRVRTDVAR